MEKNNNSQDISLNSSRDNAVFCSQPIIGSKASDVYAGGIHELFTRQAFKTPDALAVVTDDGQLTYAELDRISSRLSYAVKSALGMNKGPVVVSLKRSAESIVALLGVMKSGCAYVPLDPAHPADRLYEILNDTNTSLILTESALKPLFIESGIRTLCLDEHFEVDESAETTAESASNSIAYVIYTSGSTGKPKGVCCKHAGVINLLSDFQKRSKLAPGDICGWWTSLSFDVSLYEIFSALLEGATLYVVPEDVRSDGPVFMEWLNQRGATSAYIPPFMVADLWEWLQTNHGKSKLRRLLVGVEPIPERLLVEIRQGIPGLIIFNGYGPTETSICSTLYEVPSDRILHGNTPIGKPVQNTVLYILDENGSKVPDGSPGELFIGGEGLAEGYLNRPDLTAESFIADPFSDEPGAKLFKTGDLVRVLEDGNLEFVTRKDSQIKLRGFRIEPGEIETCMRGLAGIREAVALLREDEPGQRNLVAYYVVSEGQTLAINILKEHLKKSLPDYMIPGAFVQVDRIPFTSHGKTDRDALPKPSPRDFLGGDQREYAAPRTPLEVTLVGFFRELLRVDFVGVSDSFFDLGGQSLLAVQLITRIRKVLGKNLPVAAVFEAPTVEALARKIEAAPLQAKSPGARPITPHEERDKGPLSYSQLRVWYLDQLEPGTAAYNICLAYKLTGPLNLVALNQSLNGIVERHRSFRTVFDKEDGQPVQRVLPYTEFFPECIDISHVPDGGREEEALVLCNQEFNKGFDLNSGPLFRWLIVRQGPEEHVLVLNVHHIVSDGWSMGIVVREIIARYDGLVSSRPVELNPLPIQYTDFSWWQREWMKGPVIQSQIKFWKERFKEIPEPLDLPTDRPRPPVQSYRGADQTIYLDADLSRSLKGLAAKEGASLFMVLLAAFKALLFRYTGQGDLCVGTFVANRNRSEIEDLAGFFVNTLAIRSELSDDPTFKELIRRVRDNSLDAYANQDVPFEKVLEEVNPERNLSRTPLFQVMMVLQNMLFPPLDLVNTTCESINLDTFRSNFDLTIWLYEQGEQTKVLLDYSTDLFDPSTIARMLEHMQILLADATAHPEKNISKLDILGEAETKSILVEWSEGSADYSLPRSGFLANFESQVRQHSQKPALIDLEIAATYPEGFTYEELDIESGKIAHTLIMEGVKTGGYVAVLMNRGRPLVSGIMGVLKAGAAYVPIDTKYPEDRIAFILNDTGAPVVITDLFNLPKLEKIMENHKITSSPKVLCLDDNFWNEKVKLERPLLPDVELDRPAYVIYTSGSTGQPKGVIIPQGALSSFSESSVQYYGFRPDDRILQFASPSFDASVEEIFGAFSAGATLVIRSESMMSSLPAFIAACAEAQITVLDLPTAFWHQLTTALEENRINLPDSLRIVIIGGEQPAQDRIQAWLRTANPKIRLFNTYGPTEATVVATAVELSIRQPKIPTQFQAPLGRPLPHVKTYVLDPHLKPAPTGVPGELYIGGSALALGYLNLPEKTGESFILNPFGSDVQERLYRTGDRVRYLEGGILEFLGRMDRQVKVRGFRVELGEVEVAIRDISEVSDAVVVPWTQPGDPVQLVGYIVPQPGAVPDPSLIRKQLGSTLPDFMIPASFMVIDSLPLTPSGKINTRALPKPEFSLQGAGDQFVAPRNPIEETLSDIWREIFKLGRVGVTDNFFDLGGHSLLSLQIIDRVNRAGLYLTPAQFMQYPTIEKQAQVISTVRPSTQGETPSCLVELQPYGSRLPLYFLHSTPGDVLGYVNLINRLGADQPCYGFQSLGLVEPGESHKSLEDMANRYIDEMVAFQTSPPYYLVGWCFGGLLAAEMAHQLKDRGLEVALLVLIETPFPRMKTGRAYYYLNRLVKLAGMGPHGWVEYVKKRIRYSQKVKRREFDQDFSLEFDSGPLANRAHVYNINRKAIFSYQMRGNLSCPIRIFSGDQIAEGYIPVMEELWLKMNDDVQLYTVPGNHLTILKEPGAGEVAEKLHECLEETQRM